MEDWTYRRTIKLWSDRVIHLAIGRSAMQHVIETHELAQAAGIPWPSPRRFIAYIACCAVVTTALAVAGVIYFGPLGLVAAVAVGSIATVVSDRVMYWWLPK